MFAANPHWFQARIVEGSDLAANSLQVHHAKQFGEMLGNYSRWEFHHPGPAFFYLLAVGEYLFHDWTHLLPGAMNAQLVTLVLFNTALLFGAIELFAAHFGGRLFRPLALGAALLWIFTVNQTVPGAAVVSLWMPHVALLAFLFFAAACASVAAGRVAHLPWMAAGAMLMVHLHVAQLLFASAMTLGACAAAAVGEWRAGRSGGHGKTLALSAAIVAVFLLPIVLELAVDRPNNLDDIRAYLARYPEPHRGMAAAWRYFVSFLAFAPEAVQVQNGGAELGRRGYVAVYWGVALAALGGAVWMARRRLKRMPRLVWAVLGECLLVSLLFLYWADRITGPFYNFNGFFVYAVQLLGLWATVGVLAEGIGGTAKWARLAWVVPFAALPLMAGTLRNPDRGSDAIWRMSEELRPAGAVHLVFAHDDWDTAVGIANQLARRGQEFCVDASWHFLFGRRHVCRAGTQFARREVTGGGVFEPGRRPLRLPMKLGADDASVWREGFYECEGDHCWTGRAATLGFTLADAAAPYRITITGSVLPERRVEVSWNGTRLGTLTGLWKSSVTFVAAGSAGGMNRLRFDCAGAGPVSGDARELGFSLMTVEVGR